MPEISAEQVLTALKNVIDPKRGANIVDLDMVEGIQVRDDRVIFSIKVDPENAGEAEPLRLAAEQAVAALDGVAGAGAILTADRPKPQAQPVPPPGQGPGGLPGKMVLPEIKSIIAIASGKGGVGKSTTSTNIALALAARGLKVGLLDADIYGPSVPRMLGVSEKPSQTEDGKISPLMGYGIKCMSMGFMVEDDTPVIWRGPMATGALEQLLTDVDWGELDVLVIDMPPGTGDIHLTLAQRVPLTGAVIVSTPQDIALADARKGLNMFRKVEVPVFGIIENMSYFLCPDTNKKYYIFGRDGAKEEAKRLDVPFLGEIPLDIHIRETSDGGRPIVATEADNEHSLAYKAIADKVWEMAEAT